jgi:hypothetical protein
MGFASTRDDDCILAPFVVIALSLSLCVRERDKISKNRKVKNIEIIPSNKLINI